MKRLGRGLALGLGAVAAVSVLAPIARAGCGDVQLKQDSAWHMGDEGGAGALRLAATGPTIVGMWNEKFFSGGKLFDFGYSVWHSDGTEILNSGSRAPATQNFCLGVWKQTGASTYKLRHLALSYDASTGKLNARVAIHESVTLAADGNSFAGPFEIDVYDPNKGTLLQKVSGNVKATRIAVD